MYRVDTFESVTHGSHTPNQLNYMYLNYPVACVPGFIELDMIRFTLLTSSLPIPIL